jgi:xanthosine utilization system XapX-like protein
MNKYGPTRGELKFRIVVSMLGLAFMGFAVWYRGIPDGPALVEVVGLAGVFFGGTLVLSVRRLMKMRKAGV